MLQRFFLLVWACSATASFTQEYLWPTDASRFMTSSFGEARPRRFHAAIDIKTWNRTGYKVFATRSGYVKRIGVSPFGYGRALYLRLDTGETVVYAHLDRFNERLQEIVEREQEEHGVYRLEKEFTAGELPVQQGEVLAFTGQSGIGVPHLHFELRDAQGRPINPLHKKFGLTDNVAPAIKAIAVTPLNANAMVEGDFVPRVFTPVLLNGRLMLPQPIRVSGQIGFAVEAYDRTTGTTNQFAVYRYQFYVDGALQFQSQFDRFAYSENRLIELAHDYYLQRHEQGRFHKLYREAANTLEIYSNLNANAGVLAVATDDHAAAHELARGQHRFMIVAEDFDGNRTTVEGQLLAGAPFTITVTTLEAQADRNKIAVRLPAHRTAPEIAAQILLDRWNAARKPAWHDARSERVSPKESLLTALNPDSGSAAQPPLPPERDEQFWVYGAGAQLWRIQAQDEHGIFSLPAFATAQTSLAATQPFHLEVKKEFLPQHLRLEVFANLPLQSAPLAQLQVNAHETLVPMLPQEPNRYVGAVPLAEIAGDSVLLTIKATSVNDAQSAWEEKFSNVAITPENGGELRSADGRVRVRFAEDALYAPLYGRVQLVAQRAAHPLVLGPVYRIAPRDVPFRTNATVEIEYPETVSDPTKLGIAVRHDERWDFIVSKRSTFAPRLSAEVASFDDFAVMVDDEPPVLVVQTPAPNAHTKTRRPKFICHVVDQVSGFDSERSIELRVDGKLVIAEYDPEREIVQWQPRSDLSLGTHVLHARAEDQCGNVTEREVKFVVP